MLLSNLPDRSRVFSDDSLIVAVMRRHGLKDLASNDKDFKRVREIRLWTPK